MKYERQNAIIKLLMSKRSMRTDQLVQQFGVSIETIRRDINDLERMGAIKKVYGGVQIASDDLLVSDLKNWSSRMRTCQEEKQMIARHAVELIPDHSTIALDIGTTTNALAHLLSAKQNLTIITSSIRIAGDLSRGTDHCIYIIGGRLHNREQVSMGAFARSFLDHFASIDLFLCGADGISLDSGITEFSEGAADIKRHLISIAHRSILLADHSKFGKVSLFKCCSLSEVDTLITDRNTPPRFLDGVRKFGTEVIVAES